MNRSDLVPEVSNRLTCLQCTFQIGKFGQNHLYFRFIEGTAFTSVIVVHGPVTRVLSDVIHALIVFSRVDTKQWKNGA